MPTRAFATDYYSPARGVICAIRDAWDAAAIGATLLAMERAKMRDTESKTAPTTVDGMPTAGEDDVAAESVPEYIYGCDCGLCRQEREKIDRERKLAEVLAADREQRQQRNAEGAKTISDRDVQRIVAEERDRMHARVKARVDGDQVDDAQHERGMRELYASLAKERDLRIKYERQIDRLATAISEEHGGPSYDGGAVDNAIHMMRDMRSERISAVRALEDAIARNNAVTESADRRISVARDIAHAAIDAALDAQ